MEGAVRDLANELGFLMAGGVVYATLQHATAMTMGANGHRIGANGVKYKLPSINQAPLGAGG